MYIVRVGHLVLLHWKVLEDLKVQKEMDRELLISVARTALRTKVAQKLADQLAEVGTNCVRLPVIQFCICITKLSFSSVSVLLNCHSVLYLYY